MIRHDLARNTHTEYVYLDGRPLAQIAPRPDLWAPVQEHVLTDTQDPNQTATVIVDTQAQSIEVQLSGGGGQIYLNPPEWQETNYNDQRYLEIEDPQTGETTGYALDYSLHLYEDAVTATLHLTPMDGSPERFFTLTTTIAEYPPVKYYHTDHLDTPKALTDQNQQIVWRADYTPFGMANITTGQTSNNLRFPGQYFDAETGLHYNWHRYYDSLSGRYITSDPIGLEAGLNTYSYVFNNPVRYIDPDGRSALVGVGVGIGALGTAYCLFIPSCRAQLEQTMQTIVHEVSQCLESDDDCEEEIQDCIETCKKARDNKHRMPNVWGGSWWRCMTGCVSFGCQDKIDEVKHGEP